DARGIADASYVSGRAFLRDTRHVAASIWYSCRRGWCIFGSDRSRDGSLLHGGGRHRSLRAGERRSADNGCGVRRASHRVWYSYRQETWWLSIQQRVMIRALTIQFAERP